MTPAEPLPLRVRFGEFELDEANALLLRGGRSIDLAPTPFGLLCTLARHPGALQTKHMLLDAVWGHRFVSDSVLKTAISDLRSVLGDDSRAPRFIETVARRGYRFIAKPAALAVATSSPTDATESEHAQGKAFVGRAEELERLQRAWDRASRGKRAVVWVAGEPGIGKTTLIEHFVAGLGRARTQADTALSTTAAASRTCPYSRRWRSCAAVTTVCQRCCDLGRRPGSFSCPGSSARGIARACNGNWSVRARIACCARWASCSTATPSIARCC